MAAADILMPMRDAAPWVGAAWESLARQTFRDWRLVAVDDGSRDGTASVLAGAARGDPRLRLLEESSRGVAAALNRGLAEVAAPVVVRMDADDLSHPERLHILLDLLRRAPELGVAASRVRLFPARRVSPAMGTYLSWQNGLLESHRLHVERYVECTVTHASAAFRTAALEKAGGWWEGDGPEDLDLFLRLHRQGALFGKAARTLYFWRERPGRETRTSERMSPGAFRRTKARHLAADLRDHGQERVALFGRGKSLASWGRSLERAGVEVEVRDHRPGSPPPAWGGRALFCFGHPSARARVRRALSDFEEGSDYLFVA